MAGSRTHARRFQSIPSVTEKCYPIKLFRRTVPEPSPSIPSVPDPSVTKCDTRRGIPYCFGKIPLLLEHNRKLKRMLAPFDGLVPDGHAQRAPRPNRHRPAFDIGIEMLLLRRSFSNSRNTLSANALLSCSAANRADSPAAAGLPSVAANRVKYPATGLPGIAASLAAATALPAVATNRATTG